MHEGEDSFDSELSGYFTLSESTFNISGSAYEDKNGNSKMDSRRGPGWLDHSAYQTRNSQVSVLTKAMDLTALSNSKPGATLSVKPCRPAGR